MAWIDMRDFFKSELETLKINRGLNQWQNISDMVNEKGENIGAQSFKLLFDTMEQVASEFPYIPDDEKKRIIQYGILHEPDMMQLTPHLVWKWLNQASNKYYNLTEFNKQQKTEEESRQSNAKPLTQEELNAKLEGWLNQIKDVQENFKIPKLSQEQIQLEGQEKIEPRATAGHIPEETEEHATRRSEAIRKLGYHKLSAQEVAAMKIFKVGTHDIRARNQEEAEQIALEVYA